MKSADNTEIAPVVCIAGSNYIICIPTPVEMLVSVYVGNSVFFCDDNGVRKSGVDVQKFVVPRALLEKAGSYTVKYCHVKERKPYYTELNDSREKTFLFFPVRNANSLHIAHLSDVHGLKEAAVQTGGFFGEKLDLLILNGDISSSSNSVKEILLPLEIAFALTEGNKPCIISRGNHDLRGTMAEKLGDYYPTDNGNTYYTVDFPGVSFIVLDCGEDKDDDQEEYGGTVAFHPFRQKETFFLQSLVQRTDELFLRNKKIVLSHIPFMYRDKEEKFAIEFDIYSEWCEILREKIRPSFGLFGHIHQMAFYPAGDNFDAYRFGSPVILGGRPVKNPFNSDVEGTFITLSKDTADIVFSNSSHRIVDHIIFRF